MIQDSAETREHPADWEGSEDERQMKKDNLRSQPAGLPREQGGSGQRVGTTPVAKIKTGLRKHFGAEN